MQASLKITLLLVSIILSTALTQAAPPPKHKGHISTPNEASASNIAPVDLSPYLPDVKPFIMVEQADGSIKSEPYTGQEPSHQHGNQGEESAVVLSSAGEPLFDPPLEAGHSWHVTTRQLANNKYGYVYKTVTIQKHKSEAKKQHLEEQASGKGPSSDHYRGSPHPVYHNTANWDRVAPVHEGQVRQKGYNSDQVKVSLHNMHHLTQAWKYIKDGGIVHFPDYSIHHPKTMDLRQVTTPTMDINVAHMKAHALPTHIRFPPSLTHQLRFEHSWPTWMPSRSAQWPYHGQIKREREAPSSSSHDDGAADSKRQRNA